ncbi:TetR/AcrR family transcriptional regulator [Actinospica durhamensis]|uniref:TetR/AcrR family transcriptional regulator n=1 Tax=Actinospica durhamensis TaxID=1508375 RepID=A0A941EV22_9ACTN|nr:TetR/AcrR family transcriptional regulator [Actinospica durhamensis]MBR7837796.1 TetR/AcrR family transcriptional regulator [Actinospica durhamensis]
MDEGDRRVRRTRRALRDALIGLTLEKGYAHITVQEILDRADVVRSTFYAHHRDKDSLLFSCFDDVFAELARTLEAAVPGAPLGDPARLAEILYQHAGTNRRVYRALCGRQGGPHVFRHLQRRLGDLLREHLRPYLAAADCELPADLVADYYANAALGLLSWWVDHDFPHDPAWLAQSCRTLVVPGVLTALGQASPAS